VILLRCGSLQWIDAQKETPAVFLQRKAFADLEAKEGILSLSADLLAPDKTSASVRADMLLRSAAKRTKLIYHQSSDHQRACIPQSFVNALASWFFRVPGFLRQAPALLTSMRS
jgi:hypothetical protein